MKIRSLAAQSRSLFTLVNKIGEIVAPDDKSVMRTYPLDPTEYFNDRHKRSQEYNNIPVGIEGTMAPGLMNNYFSGSKEAFLSRGQGVKIFMLCPGIGPAVGLMHQQNCHQWLPDPMLTAQSTMMATVISGLYSVHNPNQAQEEILLLGLAPAAELHAVPLGRMHHTGQELVFTTNDLLKSYELALAQISQLTTPTIILAPFAISNTINYQSILPVLDELTQLDHVIHVAASGTIFEENGKSTRYFPALANRTVISCSFDYFGGLFSLSPTIDQRACLSYDSSAHYFGAPASAIVVSPQGNEIWRIMGSCCASANIAAIIAAYWSQHIGMDNHSLLSSIKQYSYEHEYQLADQPDRKISIFVPKLGIDQHQHLSSARLMN